ncbi:MAG: helix-turn-helix transcriptional regulator [Candidatus Brocadiaceae bacterium]|nr:helix-turn-helix transcriptional regulator [Candidatus Brocadiaceae bacterium]
MSRVEDALRDLVQYHSKRIANQVYGDTAARVRELTREVRSLRKEIQAIEGTVGELVSVRESEMAVPPADEETVDNARFSPRTLKSLRKRLSLTQKDLAKLLEVSAVTVTAWESGRSRPRKANLAQIVTLRGMAPADVDAALGRAQAPAALKPEQLKKLRNQLAITQAALAALLSVSPASIALWEAGKAVPTRKNRAALAELAGLSTADVAERLGRVPTASTPPASGLSSEQVREIRQKAGLSQRELADKLGVSANSVSNWETGRSAPRSRTVHALTALAAQ